MNKDDEPLSWFSKIKQLLQYEPQSQGDLISLLRDAHDRSLINSDTLSMVEGVLDFSNLRARDVMLPKNQMVCILQDAPLQEILTTVTKTGHSRFPVIGDGQDDIIGILHAKDLLRYFTDMPPEFDIHDLIRQVPFIPESKKLDSLLAEFRANRNHMAIVVDEYGTTAGFVTIEDIIEQIIGDIEDEFDIDEDAWIKSHGNHRFIIKAQTPIDEFNEQLEAYFSDEQYDTIGGLVMAALGHMPHRGETVAMNGFEFKIINADARRIKLLECLDVREQTTLKQHEGNKA